MRTFYRLLIAPGYSLVIIGAMATPTHVRAAPDHAHENAQCIAELAAFTRESDEPGFSSGNCLNQIARQGYAASATAPDLIALLDRLPGNIASKAIETLGYIGEPSSAAAIASFATASDERLALAALDALWRMRAVNQLPLVEQVERTHWYGPVRRFAAATRQSLATGDDIGFPDIWRDSERVGDVRIGKFPIVFGRWPSNPFQRCSGWRVAGNDFTSQSPDATQAYPADPAFSEVTRGVVTSLPTPSGLLHGIDRGEFGGGLVFAASDGTPPLRLSEQNVIALLPYRGNNVLAVVGLIHMIAIDGAVLLVDFSQPYKPRIRQRLRLPGVPSLVFELADGWLLVLHDGHSVALDHDLQLREAGECLPADGENPNDVTY